MAFAIPRIQYKNVDTTGDTHTSTTIDDIADTSLIEVGMFVRGSGIPTGATVATIAANSITISAATTTTLGNTALAFGYEILFDYPPIEPNGDSLETKSTTSESLSGVQQVAVNFTEVKRDLKFSFLSPSLYTAMTTFLQTCAILGEEFRYYPDQTSSTYNTVELDKLSVKPKKIAPRGVDTYSWEIPLTFRRVL
jgi:hypothetical protein